MRKNISEEALYERMRNLAQVNNSSNKVSENRGLGTLISYKRAADGVAYGIIKEQHQYYIKKGGLNENQTVSDFAYIGGLANITDFQYKKLSEAEKQINLVLKTINEGFSTKINKSGTKTENKRVRLTEDKAGQEIDMAASKVDDLDAATAADVPEPSTGLPEPEGAAEMDAGIDAMNMGDTEGSTDIPPDTGDTGDMGDTEGGIPPDTGDMGDTEGDTDIPPDTGDMGDAEGSTDIPPDTGDTGDMGDTEGDEAMSEMQSNVAKIANEIKNSKLDKGELTWLLKTFVKGFVPNKDETDNPTANKMGDIDDDDRHEVSDMILNVVSPEEIENLGQNVEDSMGTDGSDEIAEETCAECGGFAQYAESRGYTADSIKECGEEEMTNMVSGYANAHSEGQNDGDFKTIAILITPEILEKLKNDYGHDDFASQVEPFSSEMNEASAEDRDAQINELFGNSGLNEEGIPVDSVEVQPMMEDITFSVNDKAGKKLSPTGVPVKEMKEGEETEGDDVENVDIDNIDVSDEPETDAPTIKVDSETPIDNTEEPSPFSSGFQSMGGALVKPDGAPTTISITSENGTTVDVSMNEVMKKLRSIVSESKKVSKETKPKKKEPISETEIKIRKYIRNKLKEESGLKKPNLNENEKSETLKKLDKLITKQFNLYETTIKNKTK